MSKVTVQGVRGMLGKKADSFAASGHDFAKKRLNGPQKALAAKVMTALTAGKLATIPAAIKKDLKEAYGLTADPNEAQIAIILWGRPPVGTDKVHEASRVPTPEQKAVADKLAAKVMSGEIYQNYARKRKVTLPEDTTAAPATKAKTTTAKKTG